jgi:hypothetical protein
MKRTSAWLYTARVLVISALLIAVLVPLSAEGQAAGPCPNGQVMQADGRCKGFVPLASFSGSDRLSNIYTNNDGLSNFLNRIFMGAIALGGILAVLRLAWAGFVYMSTDLWSNKGHAKEIIQETLLGLFLLLAVWLILNFINPDILKLKVEVKQPTTSGAASP